MSYLWGRVSYMDDILSQGTLSVPQSSTTTYVHKYKIVYKSISQKIII